MEPGWHGNGYFYCNGFGVEILECSEGLGAGAYNMEFVGVCQAETPSGASLY